VSKPPPSWRTCLCLFAVGLLFVQIGVRTHQSGFWGVGASEMLAGAVVLPVLVWRRKRRERRGSQEG